ncbi:MAG: hypothetical protein ACREFJ_12905 [Acetobacteraceae bacterium]
MSAALNLLHVPIPADGEPEHYKVVLHYVTQAADIAENGIDELKWLAVNYQRKAALWRELADLEEQATTYVTATAGRMLVPDHMRIISEQCKAKGEQFMANPARLGMNRKTGAGDPMLAVRRLAGEIRRWNRGMMRHGSPGAIKLLIEAAMGCEIPETTVRRGIRANG